MIPRNVFAVFAIATWLLSGCSSRTQTPQVRQATAANASVNQRPNFLFIITDDQRYDAMSCVQQEQGDAGRFPWFKTPNMDRLARDGVRFRNAFVTESLCSPSRASFLSGQFPHIHGVVNNHMSFPLDDMNSGRLLENAGYATSYFGKWHQGKQKQRPGFETFASYIGHGRYVDCPILVNGVQTPTHGWVDDVITDYVIKYLKDHQAQHPDQPFDMEVGFKSPHVPRQPPDRAKNRFEGDAPRDTPNLNVPSPFASLIDALTYPSGENRYANLRGQTPQEFTLDYFRCISAADDCLGRILDTLDQLGLTNNTIVVFASDNGYYLREHELGDKRSAYEESMRIPLLLRYPKLNHSHGKKIDAMVLNIDLAPTLLDFAGVPIPSTMQGKSWRPLLEGKVSDANFRPDFFFEYFWERTYATPTINALRTGDSKLVEYPGHDNWTEMFDLTSDRYEIHNLASDPAHQAQRKQMETELQEQKQAVHYTVPATADKPSATSSAASD